MKSKVLLTSTCLLIIAAAFVPLVSAPSQMLRAFGTLDELVQQTDSEKPNGLQKQRSLGFEKKSRTLKDMRPWYGFRAFR